MATKQKGGGADYTNTHKPKKRGNPAIQVEYPRMKQDEQTQNKRRKKAMEKFQLGKKYSIGGRANLLEEMGRLDAERMNPNRRAEKHRVIGELNKGYKSGGRAGYKHGKWVRDPNPHVDIDKYVDKKTGKKEIGPRHRVEGSEMKSNRGTEEQRRRKGIKKGIDTYIIINDQKYKVQTMAKGGRSGYNSGGAVLKGKKVGCQIK